MSDLYDLQNATICSLERYNQLKTILLNWMEGLLSSTQFYHIVVTRITKQHKILILKCVSELLDTLYEQFDHKLSTNVLQAIGSACFMIAVKYFYGYDYIFDDKELNIFLVHMSDRAFTIEKLLKMEADILRRTDWKGCSSFLIDKKYKDVSNLETLAEIDTSIFSFGKKLKTKKSKTKKSKTKKSKKSKTKTKKSKKSKTKKSKKTKKSL